MTTDPHPRTKPRVNIVLSQDAASTITAAAWRRNRARRLALDGSAPSTYSISVTTYTKLNDGS